MLRKGVVEHVGAIMLVVISGAAIAGTLSSIQDHTLEPSQQGIEDRLQSFDTEVDIETEEQFRGLVVWNMMAAQQCAYNPMLFNWEDDSGGDYEEYDLELVEGTNLNELSDLEEQQFTYYGHGDVLREVVEETEFSGQCIGASPISIDVPLPGVIETIAGAAGRLNPSNWGDDTALAHEMWEGQSAQGRFGKADFTINNTIIIDDSKLMAFNIGGPIASSDVGNLNAPDFVRAERAAVFQPGGFLSSRYSEEYWDREGLWYGEDSGSNMGRTLRKEGQAITEYGEGPVDNPDREENRGGGIYQVEEGDSVGWREAINAFRIRMKNVPTVISGVQAREISEEEYPSDQYEGIVNEAQYVLCEGSRGFVQSNAGRDIEKDGKEYSDDPPIFRDVVYPRVELTNRDNSCVEDAEILSENWIGDRVQPLDSEEDFPSEDSPTKYYPYVDERGMWDEENGYQKFTSDLRIGEDTVVPIKSVLKPETADSLGLENWWDHGNEQGETIYRSGWAIDPDECPESSEYVITNMFYSENHETIYDESNDNVVLDKEGQTVNYSVDRFPEDSSFEINLDTHQFEHDEDGESPNVVTVRFKSYDGDSTNVGFAETGEVNIGGDPSEEEVEGSFPEHFIVIYEGEYDSLNIRWKSDPNNDYYDRDFRIDGNTGKTIEHGVDEIVVDFFGQNDDSPFGVDSFDVRGAKPAWC